MPIHLITATPRTGKTLLMMEMLVAALDANRAQRKTGKGTYRPLFALGVDGLDVTQCGYEADEVTILEHGAYEAKDKAGIEREGRQWEACPDNAIIFVDEAWKWFGDVHDARSVKRPDYVVGLAEHGHRGIDFVWTTQTTMQLFSFARGVMGAHTHMLRHLGLPLCTLFQWSEMSEDVKSQTNRDRSIQKKWRYPAKLYKIYKSASGHHVKVTLPWRMFLIPACILAAVLLVGFAYKLLKNYGGERTADVEAARGGAAAASPLPVEEKRKENRDKVEIPTTAEGWSKALTPVLPGIAYTAPIFSRSLTVNTYPRTICYLAGEPGADVCKCVTEQASKLNVGDHQCRQQVADGEPYDPFRPVVEPTRVAQSEPAPLDVLDLVPKS